jgi:hypothetical protein
LPPHVPKYVSPKEAAESRARLRARLYWTAVAIPLLLAFLAFGYSDQAPASLRSAIISLDRSLGYPIAGLLAMIF